MRPKRLLIGSIIICIAVAGCGLLEPEAQPTQAEIIIVETETPVPTTPPLVTYTPTNEPEADATLTPTAIKEVPNTGSSEPISIRNLDRVGMTVLDDKDSLEGITWATTPVESIGLLTGSELSFFDTTNAAKVSEIAIPEPYYVYDISPVGDLIACTDDYERILLLSTSNLEQQAIIIPETFVANAHFSYDGNKIIISSMDEMVAIEADTATGEILKIHSGFSTAAPVYDVVYSRYTNDLVWISRGRVQLQNPISEMLSPDFQHEDWVNAFSISPNGEYLAIATAKSTDTGYSAGIQIWRTTTGEALNFIPTEHIPSALFYSTDGSLLFGPDGFLLRFWDGITGESIQDMAGHIDMIYKASLSPSGDSILTASYDGQTILWHLP